jgi:hypothetical protein
LGGCDSAAIRALLTIDRVFHLLRDCFKSLFDKMMPLEPTAKPEIFITLPLAQAFDLDEVGNHISIISTKHYREEMFRHGCHDNEGGDRPTLFVDLAAGYLV